MSATPNNPDGKLLRAIADALAALTIDGSKAFTRVIVGIDEITTDAFRSTPVCVLTEGDSSWDNENPELGTLTVNADIFTYEVASTRGVASTAYDRQLFDLVDLIRQSASHFTDGDFLSAVSMSRAGQPTRVQRDNLEYWTVRVTFEVLRG